MSCPCGLAAAGILSGCHRGEGLVGRVDPHLLEEYNACKPDLRGTRLAQQLWNARAQRRPTPCKVNLLHAMLCSASNCVCLQAPPSGMVESPDL